MNNEQQNTIPAVGKALTVMELLCKARNAMSQAQLSQASGASISTCYRILQTLLAHGWVGKTAEGYQPAAGFYQLAQHETNAFPPLESFQPILEALSQATELGSKLSLRQGDEQVTVLRAESPQPFAVSGKVGSHFPVIEGTVGAALLCGASPEELRQLLKRAAPELEETHTPAVLPRRIEKLRQQGYVLRAQPNRWKVCAMSAAVRNRAGAAVAALTLLGAKEDFSGDHLSECIDGLRQAVRKAEALFS